MRRALRGFLRRTEEVSRAHGLTAERYELLLAIKVEGERDCPVTVTSLGSSLSAQSERRDPARPPRRERGPDPTPTFQPRRPRSAPAPNRRRRAPSRRRGRRTRAGARPSRRRSLGNAFIRRPSGSRTRGETQSDARAEEDLNAPESSICRTRIQRPSNLPKAHPYIEAVGVVRVTHAIGRGIPITTTGALARSSGGKPFPPR